MAGRSAPAAAAASEGGPRGAAGGKPGRADASPAASPAKKKKPKAGSASGFRRAFSWLRGKRKKTPAPPQPPPAPGKAEGEERDRRPRGAAKTENEKRLSVQYKAGDERPDNVFFPSSRPPHLEELHIQAQAGLKSLQDQEKQKQTKRAWDHSDASSIQSSHLSTEGDDISIRSQTPSCATETTSEDALSIRSEMIQRKGSTFRPHDSFPKSSGKGEKRRRERRTTVLGLPQHVQKELGLSNGYDPKKRPGSVAVRPSPSPQPLANGGGQVAGNAILIPTIDGKLQPAAIPEGGARVSLQALEAEAAAAADSALQRHIDRVYYDDSLLGCKTEAKLSPLVRPKSLAVPWMTTQPGSPELLGPVMSISPQGTYLSKIIPNAILPPMVDVIAISRNRVRTLSRCSLATASPSPSVRSMGWFPSLPHSREHSSSSDNWSHSQSTETIVSNTSTISSHGGRKDGDSGPNGQAPSGAGREPDRISTYSCASGTGSSCPGARAGAASASPGLPGVRHLGGSGSGRASPAYSTGSAVDGSDSASVRSDRSSTRSVSLRKMKRAPAPPRRTYSLHQKAQQLEAEGAPRGMGLPPKPDRRPPHEGIEVWAVGRQGSPGPAAGEDEVFSPSCPSETGSVRSGGLACSPDVSHQSPITADKLREAEELRAAENQGLPLKNSSPDRFGRTMSPSSGYSSQSGTPTLHAKGLLGQASSPGKKRPQPKKPERVCSLQSPTGLSVSSSLTSLSSSASDQAPSDPVTVPPPAGLPDGPAPNKMERFVIPPHPKVPAPTCPPPMKAQQAEPKTDSPAIAPLPGGRPGVPVKPGNGSPPPSPPPAYHPPPPPAKKADAGLEGPAAPAATDAAPIASEVEADAPPDSSWPPPPPPVPEEHDLSMADFPPPDEAYFFLPPAGSPAEETPSVDATEAAPAEGPPANQRTAPAGEAGAPAPLPSFPTTMSSKSAQPGAPDDSALPAPEAEPPLPPKLPVTVARLPGAQQGRQKPPTAAPSSSVLSPPAPHAPPNLKKPGNGLPPDLKKEPASRGKSGSVPKEDANLPIVTPSLLQMVRLRSVNMDAHGPAANLAADKPVAEQNGPSSGFDGKAGPQPTAPQKPIRKSLSLRGPPSASKEAASSNPLHNAVRLKASTLSSRDAPCLGAAERRAGNRMTLPSFSTAAVALPAAGEAKDGPASPLHKSPASTASFIFAKSPKKLVIESPSSPEAQANLKKNLVAELMNLSGQRSGTAPGLNHHPPSGKTQAEKVQKVPPPIAKKPLLGPGQLQPPRSPKSAGAEALSSPLMAPGERTKNDMSGRQAVMAGANGASPSTVPETPLQSPPAQDSRQETA